MLEPHSKALIKIELMGNSVRYKTEKVDKMIEIISSICDSVDKTSTIAHCHDILIIRHLLNLILLTEIIT